MRKISDVVYAGLATIQAQSMNDLCNVLRYTYVTGTYSDDEVEVVTGSYSVPCGINMTGGSKVERGQLLLVEYDVTLRLPLTTTLDTNDRITLVEKGNHAVSGTFELYSSPQFNSSVQIAQLKRVET